MRFGFAFAIVSFLCLTSLDARELKILNLNMWAVELWVPEFIAKSPSVDLEERIKRLPSEVAKLSPDIVVFEEVWNAARAEQIAESLKPLGYAFSLAKSVQRGVFSSAGNGLLIVSKLRLDPDAQTMAFSTTTRWNESKLLCRKGAIKTRVEVEPHAWVDLYATHLGASTLVYDGHRAMSFIPEETAAQVAQARELVAFIKQTRTSPDMILAADLNSHPYAFENGQYTSKANEVYRLLTCATSECAHLTDSAKDAKFFTYDTLHNSYANHADFANEPEGRIDYIFTDGPNVTPVSASLAFTEKPMSDHYGLSSGFAYNATPDLRQALMRGPAAGQ